MSLSAEEVLSWAAEWIYVPEGTATVDTDDYLLVAYPMTWSDPTCVFRIASERPAVELVDEIVTAAAGLGRAEVTIWAHDRTRPAGLVEHLLTRGGRLHEELAVLARSIDTDLPDLATPDDVELREVTDLVGQRDQDRVEVAVFGGAHCEDADLLAGLERRDRARDRVYVAYRDGAPVGSAGLALAGDVVRLWGGGVLPEARGTGVYRALLAQRLEAGREMGGRAALVKGRLTTSAPTLRRAGFEQYGEERGYRVASS